jgi:hypothetical protein
MEEQISANLKTSISSVIIPVTSIHHLRSIAPWMKLSSIMGFIVSGLLFISVITKSIQYSNTQFEVEKYSNFYLGLRIIISFIILIPCIILFNSANHLKAYLNSNNEQDLLLFFSSQKYYWRFIGLFFIVSFLLFLLTLISMVIFKI